MGRKSNFYGKRKLTVLFRTRTTMCLSLLPHSEKHFIIAGLFKKIKSKMLVLQDDMYNLFKY